METLIGNETIKLSGNLFYFKMRGDGTIIVNGKTYCFDNQWNLHRHILGIMATIDARVRVSDRRN